MGESFPVAAPEKKAEPALDLDINLDALESRVDETVPPELLSRRKGGGSREELVKKEEWRLQGYHQLTQTYAELGEITGGVQVSETRPLPASIRLWIQDRAAILSTLAYYREYAPDQESALSNAKNDLEQAVRRGVCPERQDNFTSMMNASIRKIQELNTPKVGFVPDEQVGVTPEQKRIDQLLEQFSESNPLPRVGGLQDEAVVSPQSIPKKGLLARARELFQ